MNASDTGNPLNAPHPAGPAVRPPTLPPLAPPGARRETDRTRADFADDFKPMDTATPTSVIDALLKRPARIAYEVTHGSASRTRVALLGIAVLGLLVYGVVMGCFSGGHQFWAVPVKVLAGTFLSAVICLPSLYILSAMAGSRVTFAGAWGLMVTGLALAALLLAGFAPVAWLFSQSTGTEAWMGFLHLLLWVAALGFGYRPLALSLANFGGRASSVLRLWAFIFLAVLLQMATVLRPVVGPHLPLQVGKKMFFAQHWGECMK